MNNLLLSEWFHDLAIVVIKSLIVHVQEGLMDHGDVIVIDAEVLSVDKTFDGCKLVQDNDIVILKFKVDGVQSSLKRIVLEEVDSSLFQLQVQNSATDFKQVFNDIVSRRCTSLW